MNSKSLTFIPGHHYKKYFLPQDSHRKLNKKILKMKKQFFKKYEAPLQEEKSHVTLMEFRKLLGNQNNND